MAKWHTRESLLAAALLFAMVCSAAGAAESSNAAQVLRSATESGGGIVCITRDDLWPAALEAAQKPGWLVHVLTRSEDALARMRGQAAEGGLLGRSLYVEGWDGESLPHADHLLDLLVAGADVPEREALRAIAPVRGRAWRGETMLRKPELPGSDWWTHRTRGADNNQASHDTAFQLPAMLQYAEMPRYSSYQGSLLVAEGMRVELYDWRVRYRGSSGVMPMAGKLVGRSLYSGQIVWMRDLPEQIKPAAQIGAVHDGRIYVVDGSPNRVLVFDLATGDDLPAIEPLAGETERWVNWLGISDGRLHMLLVDGRRRRHYGSSLHRAFWNLPLSKSQNEAAAEEADRQDEGLPSIVACWDLAAGRLEWQHEDQGIIDYHVIAAHEGWTYFFSPVNGMVCLDRDGEPAWRNADKDWMSKIAADPRRRNVNIQASSSLLVGPETLMFAQTVNLTRTVNQGFAFARDDGRLLWHTPKGYIPVKSAIPPDGILRMHKHALDCKTGEPVSVESPGGGYHFGHCGHYGWVPAVGMVGHVSFNFKSPCAIPPIAAGGMLHYFPSVCNCAGINRGAAAFVGAADFMDRAENRPSHPIVRGSAAGASAGSMAEAPADWPQYRGGVRRLGGSELLVPDRAHLHHVTPLGQPIVVPPGHREHRWEWLDRPTPPVTAGGLAFYGTSDGLLRAVRIGDGSEVWTYRTAGPVMTAPAVSGGRVYAGSCDGWVYCLEASSGTLVWKWRGAPAERSMLVYGKLMSSWPVISVIIDGNNLYGVAGFFDGNGSVFFALDANTGEVRWTKWRYDEQEAISHRTGRLGRAGYLALVGRDVPAEHYVAIPGLFDAATGRPPTTGPATLLALPKLCEQDVISLNDQIFLRGGNELFENPDVRNYKYTGNYTVFERSEQPPPTGTETDKRIKWPDVINRSIITPSIEGGEIAVVGDQGTSGHHTGGLSLWSLETLMESSLAKDRRLRWRQGFDLGRARWEHPELEISAVVLCRNAVLAVVGISEEAKPQPGQHRSWPVFTAWKLNAYAREDGRELWSVDLPCEPIYNGLVPAGDGSWVVVLRDGNLAIVEATK